MAYTTSSCHWLIVNFLTPFGAEHQQMHPLRKGLKLLLAEMLCQNLHQTWSKRNTGWWRKNEIFPTYLQLCLIAQLLRVLKLLLNWTLTLRLNLRGMWANQSATDTTIPWVLLLQL